MHTLLALLLVATACSDKPAAPDPKEFAALDGERKCEATLPRAKKCVDEMMAQELESLLDPGAGGGDKEVATAVAKEMREVQSFSDEAERLHQIHCTASDGYADAVVACWAEPDCKAFATCVMKKDTWRPPTSPSPTLPSPSGTAP